jgi:hypothetical protein
MGHGESASGSIEPACSEINLTDALPHIPRVGLRQLGRSIRDLPRLRADDGQTGLRPESCWNDCLTKEEIDQTVRPIAHSLRGWSGEATDRSKPSDNGPTFARMVERG